MKTRNIIIGAFTVIFCACSSSNLHEEANRVSESITISKEDCALVNKTTNRLAFKMLSEVAKQDDKQVFVSPLGLYYALSIANEGAIGKTKTEIAALLGQTDKDEDALRKLYRNIMLKDASNRGYYNSTFDEKRRDFVNEEDTLNASFLDIDNIADVVPV